MVQICSFPFIHCIPGHGNRLASVSGSELRLRNPVGPICPTDFPSREAKYIGTQRDGFLNGEETKETE